MSVFLKVVAGLYLLVIWLVLAVPFPPDNIVGATGARAIIILIAVTLSLPAVVIYAFGQVVSDVRQMREHLKAMRRYYEPAA